MTDTPKTAERTLADSRRREVVRVTLIGSAVDLSLGVAKIIFGFIAHSQALIADGIHSISDLITDGFVLYAAAHGSREADEDHPYGHKRIETVATVGLGVALFGVAVGIAYDATLRLFEPERLLKPGMAVIVVAAISVISKEIIYRYSMTIARKYRSDMLRANAWHSRSDAISSLIVIIGVVGTMAGLDYLDAIAAIGVALMIVKIAWDLMWSSVRELVDTGLEPERVDLIRKIIQSVDGVSSLHMLRTRRMGGDALADVHIQVNPSISVSEGHHISESVRSALIQEVEELTDVTVHIDTEDDQAARRTNDLPLRTETIRRAMECFKNIDEVDDIEQMTLHYLDGRIQLVLLLPLSLAKEVESAGDLVRRFQSAIKDDPIISSVEIHFG